MNYVAAFGFTVGALYLIDFLYFTFSFRKNHPETWRSIGCPETFGIGGQIKYLSMVLGASKYLPDEVRNEYSMRFLRIRILLFISVACMIVLAVFTM